jgi:hypothetical protein
MEDGEQGEDLGFDFDEVDKIWNEIFDRNSTNKEKFWVNDLIKNFGYNSVYAHIFNLNNLCSTRTSHTSTLWAADV